MELGDYLMVERRQRWLIERAELRLVAIEAEHVVLAEPDGSEVWARRSDGALVGARGGPGGGARRCPERWRGWTVARWWRLPGFFSERLLKDG